MKINLLGKVSILMLLGIMVAASAATGEPSALSAYAGILFAMVKGTAGKIAMALIMMFAGYKSYQNAVPTPLIWGALAVILIAGAPYIAGGLVDNVAKYSDYNSTN